MRSVAAAVACLALLATSAHAQEAGRGTGLETGGDQRIRVVVGELPEDALRLGLNREALVLRCEQLLAQNGLEPVDAVGSALDPTVPELRITVRVEALIYQVDAELWREMSYSAGGVPYYTMSPVWRRATPESRVLQLSYVAKEFPPWRGRSHEPLARVGHASYVVDAVLLLVERFCADFLAANSG